MILRLYTWCASWGTLLKDEQGSWSSARCSFWLTLLFTLLLIALDAFTRTDVVPDAYALLGTIVTFCAVWASGPRMAQYLAPQIGAAVKGIAEAGKARLKGTDNARTDDER